MDFDTCCSEACEIFIPFYAVFTILCHCFSTYAFEVVQNLNIGDQVSIAFECLHCCLFAWLVVFWLRCMMPPLTRPENVVCKIATWLYNTFHCIFKSRKLY